LRRVLLRQADDAEARTIPHPRVRFLVQDSFEQYGLIWSRVDLVRKLITIPKSKNGNTRHVPLNSIALAAFQELFARSSRQGGVFVNMQGEPLKGYKHWFDPALREAGISFFTWYCFRHKFASRLVMAGVDFAR
jgi:integrase